MLSLDRFNRELNRRGIEGFGLSVDTPKLLEKWHAHLELKDVVLLSDADPKLEVTRLFGLEIGGQEISGRSMILIDEQGHVVFFKRTGMHRAPDFQDVLNFVDKR
jgi:peroxiredoxin